jgi:hypothetical protein
MGSGRAPSLQAPVDGRLSSRMRAAVGTEASGTWRGLRPLKPRLSASLDIVEEHGGGMLKLLRNVIILRALWRMFRRGRRV